MKAAVVPRAETPSHCSCGGRLVRAGVGKRQKYDVRTGAARYGHRMVCERARWWRPFHDSYLVSVGGVYLDEQYL